MSFFKMSNPATLPQGNAHQGWRGLMAALALGLASAGVAPVGSALAQVDADFSRYCRENHPGSAYQRRNQSWGVEHACNSGGVRQGIDLGRVCELTTGSRDHNIIGQRVICSGQLRDDMPDMSDFAGGLDFGAYCREFHPGSAYEKRFEAGGVEFYCRQPGATGGFTLQEIDLARACLVQHGAQAHQVDGSAVMCFRGDRSRASEAERPVAGGGGGGGGAGPGTRRPPGPLGPEDIVRIKNRPFPLLDPRDVVDAEGTGELGETPVKFANLKGCGHGDPAFALMGFDDIRKSTADPAGLDGAGWDHMGISLPCEGLTGGMVVSFAEVCARGGNQTVMARPSGRPICWRVGGESSLARQGADTLNSHFGLGGASLTGACMQAYAARHGLPSFDHVGMAVLLKYQLQDQKVECFYLSRTSLMRLIGLGG